MIFLKNSGADVFLFIFSRYDHPHILAGAGTMGLEIIKQIPDLDACIIPIGGGGLIAGSAVALKFLAPKCKIIVSIQNYSSVKLNEKI